MANNPNTQEPDVFMIWEGISPDTAISEILENAIEYVARKYGLDVYSVGCQTEQQAQTLRTAYPNISVYQEPYIYAPHHLFIFGEKSLVHPGENNDNNA